ncbi:MAG: 30S ribosome-binding factor RbfA [Chloroflexota bacterium]|nr:30S ribosome-binding factor RbfA [Chloroflexota bacterium]
MSRRTERLNYLIRDELGEMLLREVKDPRLDCFLSVTRVSITSDLRHARVFVSVMGSEQEKQGALEGLASAAGFFHRELKGRLSMRCVPTLSFHEDDSIERGAAVLRLIGEVAEDTDPAG